MATAGFKDGSCGGIVGAPKKKQRICSSTRLSCTQHVIYSSDQTITENPRKQLGSSSPYSPSTYRFNDPATADVILDIRIDSETPSFDSLEFVSE